ncbi:hypothetical protein C8J57DRAFT_1674636 [Mycena rebaudengoi]|nr:hypothetical protein C8J57DRAFT_1674636 [Mycena rebaudengoi]
MKMPWTLWPRDYACGYFHYVYCSEYEHDARRFTGRSRTRTSRFPHQRCPSAPPRQAHRPRRSSSEAPSPAIPPDAYAISIDAPQTPEDARERARTQDAARFTKLLQSIATTFSFSATASSAATDALHFQSTEYQIRVIFHLSILHTADASGECAQLRRALAQQTCPTRTRARRPADDRAVRGGGGAARESKFYFSDWARVAALVSRSSAFVLWRALYSAAGRSWRVPSNSTVQRLHIVEGTARRSGWTKSSGTIWTMEGGHVSSSFPVRFTATILFFAFSLAFLLIHSSILLAFLLPEPARGALSQPDKITQTLHDLWTSRKRLRRDPTLVRAAPHSRFWVDFGGLPIRTGDPAEGNDVQYLFSAGAVHTAIEPIFRSNYINLQNTWNGNDFCGNVT